jgi:hypothetical protein
MVTDVRQRVTREQIGRRGATREQVWVNRRMLLTGADHLSDKQWRRLEQTLQTEDPTNPVLPPRPSCRVPAAGNMGLSCESLSLLKGIWNSASKPSQRSGVRTPSPNHPPILRDPEMAG